MSRLRSCIGTEKHTRYTEMRRLRFVEGEGGSLRAGDECNHRCSKLSSSKKGAGVSLIEKDDVECAELGRRVMVGHCAASKSHPPL
jgi:hypothetical protein